MTLAGPCFLLVGDQMTLEEAVDAFLAYKRKRAETTLLWYSQQFKAWLAWLNRSRITGLGWLDPAALDDFLAYERKRGVSESTVHARFRALRALFRWLKKRKKLAHYAPPTEEIEPPAVGHKIPRQADPVIVQRVIDSIGGRTWIDYRDRMILELLRSTGLRIEEAVELRVGHVDLRDGFVLVLAGKGDKPRLVPFDDAFRKAFVAYMFNRPAWPGDELILGATGHRRPTGPIATNGVRQIIYRRCEQAGVERLNPHSFRHMFAIKALNDGVSLSAVSAMLGHTSPAFTARVYAKWVKRGLRREYDQHWRP